MQNVTESWTDRLRGHLHQLPAQQSIQASSPALENVVEADFSRSGAAPARVRPVLEAAANAVTRMVDLIESTERRAGRAEQELQMLSENACAELDERKAQIKALEEALANTESRSRADARTAAAQLKAAETRASMAEARAEDLDRQLSAAADSMARMESLIVAGNDRVLAAEVRASEAKADIKDLETLILEQLGRLGGSSAVSTQKTEAA